MSQCVTKVSQCVTKEIAMDAGFVAEVPSNNRMLYYGWVMLPLSMGALIASSPGQTFGVSIFNEPMRSSLGLSHGQLAAAYMLGTLLGAIPIAYIGRQMDRHGLRRTMFAGLVRDWQGNFDLALVVFAIAPLPVAVLSLLVAPPAHGTFPKGLNLTTTTSFVSK